MSKLSFISSDDRAYNVSRILSLIKSDITTGLKNAKRVVVKPSCYVNNYQLSATHVEAIEALLQFVSPHIKSQIVLAESCAQGNTLEAFRNYEYFDIQEKYDLALVDLSKDETKKISLMDERGKNKPIDFPATLLNSDYLISIAPPKTHHLINYTGILANLFPGSLDCGMARQASSITKKLGLSKNNGPSKQALAASHHNIKTLSEIMPVSLAIADGYSVMQGNGPGRDGELSAAHWAVASINALEVDLLCSELLGFNTSQIPYLNELSLSAEKEDVIVVGDELKNHFQKIKFHQNFSV